MLTGVGERTWWTAGAWGLNMGRGGLGKGCSSTGVSVICFLPNYHAPLPALGWPKASLYLLHRRPASIHCDPAGLDLSLLVPPVLS